MRVVPREKKIPSRNTVNVFRGVFLYKNLRNRKMYFQSTPLGRRNKYVEFVEGVKAKETLGIAQILEGSYEGKKIRMNGAVHNVRDMGEVAFVILRKAEGLVQCVYEEGVTNFDIHDLKEESAVEVLGTVKAEERAPHGFEIRLEEIKVLSQPAEPMPIPISKWKMNTSLETKLALRRYL